MVNCRKSIGITFFLSTYRTVKNYFFRYLVDILKIISPEITIPARGVNTDRGTRGVTEALGTTV